MDTRLTEESQARAKTAAILNAMSSRTLKYDDTRMMLVDGDNNDFYFGVLASTATGLARSNMCSSFLAGQGNESDDTADIGFCLGKGEYDKAENVLKALGLPTDDIVNMPAPEWTPHLDNEYYFHIEGDNSQMIFFLVGERDGVWGGLVGAGVWT